MKKIKIVLVMMLLTCLISGCSTNKGLVLNEDTIEYGEDISKVELFKYDGKVVTPKLSMDIDTKVVGTYKVTATYEEETITKDIKVVDNEVPQIEFNQGIDKSYEIPFGYEFDLKANIKKVTDKVDGDITNISVVKKEEYEKVKTDSDSYKKELSERIFKTNEELESAKESKKEKNSYVVVYSDIDTKEAKEYQVNILAVDSNFNITEQTYKVKVLEKDKKASDDKLAIGSKKGSSEKASTTKSSKSSVGIDKTESTKSVSTSNKVAKAALARVGQSLWCDELCSKALEDAGVLTGDKSHFPGGVIALSCYESIGKKISKSQLKAGDIIYYNNAGAGVGHVAVYVGNNKAVHGGSKGKVVLGGVNIGDGPAFYLRMPAKFTWDEAFEMVFGFSPSSGESASNPGGKNPNVDVYTERNVTKDNEKFSIEGKNIDVNALDALIKQFLNSQVNRDTFVSKVKGLGCKIDSKVLETPPVSQDVSYESKVTINDDVYIIRGVNVNQDAVDSVIRSFMLEEIDEPTFYQKAKELGCTVTKN